MTEMVSSRGPGSSSSRRACFCARSMLRLAARKSASAEGSSMFSSSTEASSGMFGLRAIMRLALCLKLLGHLRPDLEQLDSPLEVRMRRDPLDEAEPGDPVHDDIDRALGHLDR